MNIAPRCSLPTAILVFAIALAGCGDGERAASDAPTSGAATTKSSGGAANNAFDTADRRKLRNDYSAKLISLIDAGNLVFENPHGDFKELRIPRMPEREARQGERLWYRGEATLARAIGQVVCDASFEIDTGDVPASPGVELDSIRIAFLDLEPIMPSAARGRATVDAGIYMIDVITSGGRIKIKLGDIWYTARGAL